MQYRLLQIAGHQILATIGNSRRLCARETRLAACGETVWKNVLFPMCTMKGFLTDWIFHRLFEWSIDNQYIQDSGHSDSVPLNVTMSTIWISGARTNEIATSLALRISLAIKTDNYSQSGIQFVHLITAMKQTVFTRVTTTTILFISVLLIFIVAGWFYREYNNFPTIKIQRPTFSVNYASLERH